jgi:hypothetical protein
VRDERTEGIVPVTSKPAREKRLGGLLSCVPSAGQPPVPSIISSAPSTNRRGVAAGGRGGSSATAVFFRLQPHAVAVTLYCLLLCASVCLRAAAQF